MPIASNGAVKEAHVDTGCSLVATYFAGERPW